MIDHQCMPNLDGRQSNSE
ncbi:unnamed protein product, partial [Didymodactylos carnosus]